MEQDLDFSLMDYILACELRNSMVCLFSDTEEYSCEYGSLKFYALCGFGGVLSCGLTHTAVVPLDLVKCRIQVCKLQNISNFTFCFWNILGMCFGLNLVIKHYQVNMRPRVSIMGEGGKVFLVPFVIHNVKDLCCVPISLFF